MSTLTSAADAHVPSFGPGKTDLVLTVNAQQRAASVEPCRTLLEVLRDQFGLTGAKQVCDRGTCGACTVLLSGKRIYSCSVLAIDAQDEQITTIESLNASATLDPLQQAFIDFDASQCGYCTPGFIMSAKAFLSEHPAATLDDIRRGLSGNYCRCGTYEGIEKALLALVQSGSDQP